MPTLIDTTRELHLNPTVSKNGTCVVYIMSRDQRVNDNHALLHAQARALELKMPLVVVFNLLHGVGVRSREHFTFMLDGLKQVARDLEKINAPFVITSGQPLESIVSFCAEIDPAHIYTDFNPIPGVRAMQKNLADKLARPFTVVDTHNIIPAWVTSDKQEFAAHTIRRKIHNNLQKYLVEPGELVQHPYPIELSFTGMSFEQAYETIQSVDTCGIKHDFDSGELAAYTRLSTFISKELSEYAIARNDMSTDMQSGLSPYLHFGQISSLRVALEVLYTANETPLLFNEARMASAGPVPSIVDGMNVLYEEMIVRKELSDNFCLYGEDPTKLSSAPAWAQQSLDLHRDDEREHVYTLVQFEAAQTHDEIWNAAQRQLTRSGKMHGYMRMYWAKKILEWSRTPEEALQITIYLNDHYSLDGGDPNGYVGILWSIAGLHDRPWQERPIFGKVRYMNAAGLKRKFDIDAYSKAWPEA